MIMCRVSFMIDLRERARMKTHQIGFFAWWKTMGINIQPPEDIVYIKRRFATPLGSCTDIADHTNGHIFARVGFEEKKPENTLSFFVLANCNMIKMLCNSR